MMNKLSSILKHLPELKKIHFSVHILYCFFCIFVSFPFPHVVNLTYSSYVKQLDFFFNDGTVLIVFLTKLSK